MKNYAYFFTRQDISPEQQIVQTAHAALQLGVESQRWTQKDWDDTNKDVGCRSHVHPSEIDPAETYFTVVGVRNLEALKAVQSILLQFKFRFEMFFEPDLNDGEFTSIAVYPIPETEKGPLAAFNLLKVGGRH